MQLQPSMSNHPTFTDFQFVISTPKKVLGFIEVKKGSVATLLEIETNATAQALREAHILLNDSPIPFILTNSVSGTRQLVELVLGRQSGTSAMHAFMIFVLRKNGYFHAAQRIEVIWNWDTECCETTSEGISRRKIVMV